MSTVVRCQRDYKFSYTVKIRPGTLNKNMEINENTSEAIFNYI